MRAAATLAAPRRNWSAPPSHLGRWLPLLFIVIAAAQLAVVAITDPPTPVVWFDVGAPGDSAYVDGMQPPEHDASGQWRWTQPTATLTVPLPNTVGNGRWRADLWLTSPGVSARDLLLTCGPTSAVVPLSTQFTDLTATIVCPAPDDTLSLTLATDPVRPLADGRALGVAIREVRVTAVTASTIWQTRLQRALAGAALLTGAVATLTAVAGIARPTPPERLAQVAGAAALTLLAVGLATVTATGSPWLLALTAPRPALLALATGLLALDLAFPRSRGVRVSALALAALLPLIALGVPDPPLVLTTVAQWSRDDPDARLLLPWLVVALGLAAVALGGRRAPLVAASAHAVAFSAALVPLLSAHMVQRWSLTLTLPDWSAPISLLGAWLLTALLLGTLVTAYASATSRRSDHLRVILLVSLVLSTLLPWRALTTLLNGDEPHYTVIARSLLDDRDLELLDDYRDQPYRNAVYSPDGNVAVERTDGTDRYAAVWAPTSEPRWLLVPPDTFVTTHPALSPDPDPDPVHRVIPATTSRIVRSASGDLDALPPLIAATDLVLAVPISAPCQPLTLLIAAPDAPTMPIALRVSVTDAAGTPVPVSASTPGPEWRDGIGTLTLIPPDATSTDCRTPSVITVRIRADTPVVAQLIDTSHGLRILPASPAATPHHLGPLPSDDFGSQEAVADLTLANPNDAAADATITLHTATPAVAITQHVSIPPQAAVRLTLPQQSGAAVTITASAPIAATLIGWLPGGSYVAPHLQPLTTWALAPDASADHVAGLRITMLSLEDADKITTTSGSVTLCGGCAIEQVSTTSDTVTDPTPHDRPRTAVGAVQFTEVSGPLHFDVLLPLLLAAPAGFLFPWGGLLVPALSTLALALGLLRLLQRLAAQHLDWPPTLPVAGATLAVLLAPVSPFAVRLYTEPVAAALIVWALVWLDDARRVHRRWIPLSAVAAVTAALPLLHGRYLPLAGLLAVFVVWSATRDRRRLLLLAAPLAALALTLLALTPLAVALQSRGSPSYLSTEWLPHNLAGMLLDRGSGLLIWAPWVLLALCCPPARRSHPLQHQALLLIAMQASVTLLRAGGWQTFSPPARYLLPVIPLIALFAVPGALRLRRTARPFGRIATAALLSASVATTYLLHWAAPVGYALPPRYPLDTLAADILPVRLLTLAPHLAPGTSSNLTGFLLLAALWLGLAQLLMHIPSRTPRTNADSPRKSH